MAEQKQQGPAMTEREYKRAQRIAMFGSNIPKSGQRKAFEQAEAAAEKKGAALRAGFEPPTVAATGDLLKRRLELFKGMQGMGREKASELYGEAEGLGISRSGFRQALNRTPLTTSATPLTTSATPLTTSATPTTAPTPPMSPAGAEKGGVDLSNIDWNDPFKGVMEPDKGAQPTATTPTPVDPKSREGQVATMLRTIESEAGRGESNAEILRRLNDQRVAQGQAPLRIKLTEPKKFPVDPSLTNALFGGMRFAPSGVK